MDNAVTNAFIHSNIRQKRSKAWDMRYHWMRDKETLKLFRYYWAKGDVNEADYFSKHHPPKHHLRMRPKYILKNFLVKEKIFHVCTKFFPNDHAYIDTRRGCVDAAPTYKADLPRAYLMTQLVSDVFTLALKAR